MNEHKIKITAWEEFTNNLTITRRSDKRPQEIDCELSIDEPRLNTVTGQYEVDIDIDCDQNNRGLISLNRQQITQLRDFLNKCLNNNKF